ncbi:MAG: hypothetical protein ABEK12_04115, partial [Candidatus Nanohaloarchaea archaeon]
DLARLSLSETQGQELRAEVTVETTATKEWTVRDGIRTETFQEERVVERRAVTWAEAVRRFLVWNEEVRDRSGRMGRGEPGTEEYETFDIDLDSSFSPEYAKKEYAQLQALARETTGGEYPDVDLEREGQYEDPYIAFFSLTASTAPEGDLVPPVDHDRMVVDTWSGSDGVYQALNRVMDRLGIEDYVYHRQGEPHAGGGLATGYRHDPVLVIFDAADLDEEPTAEDFRPPIEAHVEKCEWAGEEAHQIRPEDPEESAINVEPVGGDGVADVAAYMAEYVSFDTQDLAERDLEYVAYSGIQWATNSQKHTRSTGANHAIRADRCKQAAADPERDQELGHGEKIVRATAGARHDFECAACGSPWGIDQDSTLMEHRVEGTGTGADSSLGAGFEWLDRPSGEVRARIRTRDARAAAGVDPSGETWSFERPPKWGLEAVIDGDGEEHRPSGGGVDMRSLFLPENRKCECGVTVSGRERVCPGCGQKLDAGQDQ